MKKKLLVIGSAVADVVVNIPHLPHSQEDLLVSSQQLSLGGCAANVAQVLKALAIPFDLFAPIGSGIYGDYVAEQLNQRGLSSLIPRVNEPNGCCYCLVEQNGERTFLADHGAEYRFQADWFSLLHPEDYDGVYVCGLDLEETGASVLIDHLRQANYPCIYFAAGPRHHLISSKFWRVLEALPCVFHFNEDEPIRYFHTTAYQEAAAAQYHHRQMPLIVTRGASGCFIQAETAMNLEAFATTVTDTIGAGDTHIAAFMAARQSGCSLREAGLFANRAAALALTHTGVQFSTEDIAQLQAYFPNHG